ncbi:MAG: hypothetical protein ACRD0Z_07340 [Acidimicrobiales bacterium]
MTSPRLTIDPWDPAYGVSVEIDDLEQSDGSVVLDIEVPAAKWAPIAPVPGRAGSVLFVDGVRRIEAYVWIEGEAQTQSGICASFAAGAVRCNGSAKVVEAAVGRGLFSASPDAVDLATAAGLFSATRAKSPQPPHLSLAVQQSMGKLEQVAAERSSRTEPADLIVIDGPLRGRAHLEGAIGFVKTHHVAYLPVEQHGLVGRLQPGQRTPLFLLGTSWTRYSWYLRLGREVTSPWSGVVRCECSEALAPSAAGAMADLASATLPRFASEPHKDSRAPQNLYPIGALERELRRRLGDSMVIYRALRAAASAVNGP